MKLSRRNVLKSFVIAPLALQELLSRTAVPAIPGKSRTVGEWGVNTATLHGDWLQWEWWLPTDTVFNDAGFDAALITYPPKFKGKFVGPQPKIGQRIDLGTLGPGKAFLVTSCNPGFLNGCRYWEITARAEGQ